MSKMFNPFIMLDEVLMPTPTPASDVGGHTGQSSPDAYPCSFADWQTYFASDFNGDGNTDFADYSAWWLSFNGLMGFDEEAWSVYNPGEDYPGGGSGGL